MNTDCLHLQEIPLPDIPPPSRHHKQKHPNDCSELRHRCCRRNCRNFPIYKADGKDWQLCLRKKRRYLSNSSSLSSCLLYCYTLNVVETQIFIQSLTLLITHHGLSLWTWHLQVQTGGESFFSLVVKIFYVILSKNPQSLTFLLHISHNPLVSPAHSSPPFWGLTRSKRQTKSSARKTNFPSIKIDTFKWLEEERENKHRWNSSTTEQSPLTYTNYCEMTKE